MSSRSSPAPAALLCALCLLGLAGPAVARPAAAATYAGHSLEEALLSLEEQGLKLIFTDRVVRADMRVGREPTASDPRGVLAELLAPHGLTFRESVGGILVIVPAEPPATAKAAPSPTDGSAAAPMPMPLMVEEIDVTGRRLWLAGEGIAGVGLDRDRLVSLPQIGDDLLRPLTLLPGTSGNDLSAQFSVRGGRYDEVMVRLDGLEILEPYHLKDFSNALSILAPSTIGGVELLKGGFSVEYGDRMGGVLDMTTVKPSWPRRTELGASALHLQGSGSGSFNGGRGSWLGSLRVGSLGPAAKVANEQRDPTFSDLSAKVEHDLGARQSLRGNVLTSRDSLDFVEQVGEGGFSTAGEGDEPPDEEDGSLEDFTTSYDSDYAWLTHEAVAGRNLYFESMVSFTRIGRDRVGLEQFEDGRRNLSDERTLDAFGVTHGWSWQLGGHEVKGGFELRRLDAGYDYENDRVLADPLAAIRQVPRVGTTDFHESFRGEHYGFYLADLLHPWQALSLEIGLRYDEDTLVDEDDVSPRASLAWSLGARSRLRAAWGMFYQSQRPYELQAEDGETRFQPAERSEHHDVGFESTFGGAGRPLTLRVELYERRVHDPRVRFENLFDPVSLVPELEPDRVRIAPESARARGLEVFFGGKAGDRLDWFVAYTYARVEDHVDGRDVPRAMDQPHALGLDLGYRSRWKWDFNVAVEAHSGWPTTAISARLVDDPDDDELVVEPALGPLNGERLPDYFRLDLRVSRRWQTRHGELRFFLDVQNLTNAGNVRGFNVAFETSEMGVRVDKTEKYWGPLFPSFGLRWSF